MAITKSTELRELEKRSIDIIREANAQFKNMAVLWSMGKDSTCTLWLCRKAFFGKIPFPVIHIDTGYNAREPAMYEFREKIAREWGFNLIVTSNDTAIKQKMSPKQGSLTCCTALKTMGLKLLLAQEKYDALLLSIRRDEHGIRAKERFFSPRDDDFKWDYKNQPAEMWDLYVKPAEDFSHMRVHPILHWTELNVWEYVKQEQIPVNPLYFAKNGKRYRSLGCQPCTVPVPSTAQTIDEIVEELETSTTSERAGRSQDKEKAYMMQKLRALGYM